MLLPVAEDVPATVLTALHDDLNTPRALAALFELARETNKATDPEQRAALGASLRAGGALLGLLEQTPAAWFAANRGDDSLDSESIEAQIAARAAAKANRDFAEADRIRDALAAAGVRISDGPEGTRWQRVGAEDSR